MRKMLLAAGLFVSFNSFAITQRTEYPENHFDTSISDTSPTNTPALSPMCVPEGPRVALTFDDGPYPGRTDGILSTLRTYNVPATFFVLGERVKMFPKTLQAVVADGHEIGVHTYSHQDLFKLSAEQRNQQILKGWQAIHDVSPQTPIMYWRAPYGNVPKTPIDEVHRLGLKHVGWSIDTLDWTKETADMWRTRVNSGLNSHAKQIILMHDHAIVSGQELENLIVSLREHGYQLVSLSMFEWPTCPSSGLMAGSGQPPDQEVFHSSDSNASP